MVVVPDLRNPGSFRLDKSTFPVLDLAHPEENIAIKIQINHKKRTDLNMLLSRTSSCSRIVWSCRSKEAPSASWFFYFCFYYNLIFQTKNQLIPFISTIKKKIITSFKIVNYVFLCPLLSGEQEVLPKFLKFLFL